MSTSKRIFLFNKKMGRRFLSLLFVLCGLLSVLSCSRTETEEETSSNEWKTTQMPFNYQNVQIPRELWQYLKDALREDGVRESDIDEFTVLPVSVRVDLMSNDEDVLRDGKNHRVTFIDGGGELDLFSFVSGKGLFSMRFMPELDGERPMHLFYLSDSPGKDIQGDWWGNGCGRIFDLSEKIELFANGSGIKVATTRKHYLHLMAGTFLFFQLVDGRLFLGYIRVKDSRYPKFTCSSL